MPTCMEEYDPSLISAEDALQRISQALSPVQGYTQLAIRHALGRVLAEPVKAPVNVPAYDSSMMDGYALRGGDLPRQGTATLQVIDTVYAGRPVNKTLQAGECVRIFTGGVVPAGADTVVMQEHVAVLADQQIAIEANHQAGQFVFHSGDDIQLGQTVLAQGKRLLPADIGLLASLGIAEVRVKRRLRVAFFSTGDELCAISEIPQPGQIYDSNRYTLYSMLKQLGVELLDLGVVRDDPQAIEQSLLKAAQQSDVIISSGGVSVGDADYVTQTLQAIGEMNFWKMAVKPGRPLTFGKIQAAVFFGLPGNPVAVMGTFYEFVQPALRKMMGQTGFIPLRFKIPCLSDLKKTPGRLEFQRGIISADNTGQLVVRSTGKQASGILTSMSQANCFIVLPVECANVAAGSEVLVEPFEGLIT